MNNATERENLLAKIAGRIPLHPEVTEAIGAVPREAFVPANMRALAYKDGPLPIGEDQTVSQPSLVAMMTAQLGLTGDSRVLEIGTGCGYQTAILSNLARDIFTIEVRGNLSRDAQSRLNALGHVNVHFKIGDGMLGWKEAAPFDAILITAAAESVPDALVDQLRTGGLMVFPMKVDEENNQELFVLTKTATGPQIVDLFPVQFVPIVARDPKTL